MSLDSNPESNSVLMEETNTPSDFWLDHRDRSDWDLSDDPLLPPTPLPPALRPLASDIFLHEHQSNWPLERRVVGGNKKTIICVLFNNQLSSHVSRLRICLCCRDTDISQTTLDDWNVAVDPTPPSVAHDLVRDYCSDSTTTPLRELCIAFKIIPGRIVAPQYKSLTRKKKKKKKRYSPTPGKLVLAEPGFVDNKGKNKPYFFFDTVYHLSTLGTQSLTVSFAHSTHVYTSMELDGLTSASTSHVICRTVQIVRTSPNRQSIPLPTEVLLMIFEHLGPHVHLRWRRDLLSCALVCRNWRCASDFLLRDVTDGALKPQNVIALGNTLEAEPKLGLAIRTLDMHSWDFAHLSPSQHVDFARAFVHILHAARNTRDLSLPAHRIGSSPTDEVVAALHGLQYLRTFRVYQASRIIQHSNLNGQQFASCVASWPSLQYLGIVGLSGNCVFDVEALPPPTCALDTLKLYSASMKDGLLHYITSSSTSSLKHVVLDEICNTLSSTMSRITASNALASSSPRSKFE